MNWTKKKSTTRHGSLHANERFWVSLHVLYVLIKHCCAVFTFSRGCDRYVHAQGCIPRTALPVRQMNQVSLWITIKGDQKKVSESERAKAKQSSERQKNSDINLSSPSEDPSDPAGPVNHRDLEHLAAHYGRCPACEKHSRAHSHTLPTINTSPPPPCTLSATCLSLAASEHRKTWRVPAKGFPLILPQILTWGMTHLSLSCWKTCSVLVFLAA